MIDFTNSIKKNKAYAGANGSKIAVVRDQGFEPWTP